MTLTIFMTMMTFLPMNLDAAYWDNRYKSDNTGWDLGQIAPPLKHYIDQLPSQHRSKKILIPGAGYGHEAIYLWQKGFVNVTLLDLSETAFAKAKQQHPNFPHDWQLVENFFDHTEKYDLIIEQTFFCSLDPSLRAAYAKKMHGLLNPGGKVIGLLFDQQFNLDGPPFGGSQIEYKKLFAPYFKIKTIEPCYNSAKPRQGSELFFIFEKRDLS